MFIVLKISWWWNIPTLIAHFWETSSERNFDEIVLSSRITYLLLRYMFMFKLSRIYMSLLSISIFSKANVSRKLVWLGGIYIFLTVIVVVLGNKVSKKVFWITCRKNSFCTEHLHRFCFYHIQVNRGYLFDFSIEKIDLSSSDSVIPIIAALARSAI